MVPFLESVKRRFVLYLILLKFLVSLNCHYPFLNDKIIIDATLSLLQNIMFLPLILKDMLYGVLAMMLSELKDVLMSVLMLKKS
jgi:hypothetical protein